MAYRTNSHRTAKRSAHRRAATILRRRSERVTFVGTLDGLLRYILSRWLYNFPWELHQVEPCHDQRIVHLKRVWLPSVMAELAGQWQEIGDALRAAGFLSPPMN